VSTDLLVRMPLWSASALTSGGTLTSAAINNRRFSRIESLMFKLTVSAGNPDIKIEYLVSEDDSTYSSVISLVASTATSYSGSPSGENVVPMPAPLAPYFKIKLTELASKATTVTLVCLARER